jgi:hypothetical protein
VNRKGFCRSTKETMTARDESPEDSMNADTFWRALCRPFRRMPEHISTTNKLAFSYHAGDDEPISSTNRFVRCDLDALPNFEDE